MFGSTEGFHQEIHDNSTQPHTLDEDLSLQHLLNPCLTIFALEIFYIRPFNCAHQGFKQRQRIRPWYSCLGNDKLSQLLAIQGPSHEGVPVLLIQFHARAVGSPTNVISDVPNLEKLVDWCCPLAGTSSFFFFLLHDINEVPSIT